MEFIKKYWLVIVATFGLCMFIKPAFCFIILGSLVSYMGLTSILFINKIGNIGIEWTGNIIDYESDSDGHKIPVIEFTTIAGEEIKEKPFIYSSTDLSKIRSYKNFINNSVPILYDPDDPRKFVLKDEEGFNYIVFVISILAGLFFVGLGICWLLGYIKMG